MKAKNKEYLPKFNSLSSKLGSSIKIFSVFFVLFLPELLYSDLIRQPDITVINSLIITIILLIFSSFIFSHPYKINSNIYKPRFTERRKPNNEDKGIFIITVVVLVLMFAINQYFSFDGNSTFSIIGLSLVGIFHYLTLYFSSLLDSDYIRIKEDEFVIRYQREEPIVLKYSEIQNIKITDQDTMIITEDKMYDIRGDITQSSVWEEFKQIYIASSLSS